MGKTFKIIIWLAIAGLLIGGGIAYYAFNKPHTDVAGTKPHHIETAVNLYEKVKDIDLTQPNEYSDKIVEVSGIVAKVDSPNDSILNIFLAIDDMGMNNVVCAIDIQTLEGKKPPPEGETAIIKGIFTGVNKFEDPDFGISTTDIMLSRCVITE